MQSLNPSIIDSWARPCVFRCIEPGRGVGFAGDHRNGDGRSGGDGAYFDEKPVGRIRCGATSWRFPPASFPYVVGWLALNHGALDVFVHPNTGDELRDHRDCALWLGKSYVLNLAALAD